MQTVARVMDHPHSALRREAAPTPANPTSNPANSTKREGDDQCDHSSGLDDCDDSQSSKKGRARQKRKSARADKGNSGTEGSGYFSSDAEADTEYSSGSDSGDSDHAVCSRFAPRQSTVKTLAATVSLVLIALAMRSPPTSQHWQSLQHSRPPPPLNKPPPKAPPPAKPPPHQCHDPPAVVHNGIHRPLVRCTNRVCTGQLQSVAGTVITGTGRAGTSFLMAVLSSLGMPTGFGDSASKQLKDSWHAGFERSALPACLCRNGDGHTLCLRFEQDVQIIKAPQLAEQNQFPLWLTPPASGLANVIVPVRSSNESAASRDANGNQNGGFSMGATDHLSQQHADEHLLSTLIVELSKQDVPVTLLYYPRHVLDARYSADKLGWLLRRYNISKAAFVQAHTSLLNPAWVHSAFVP